MNKVQIDETGRWRLLSHGGTLHGAQLIELAPRGVMAFHISNRNMDLAPALSAVARTLGLTAMMKVSGAAGEREGFKASAMVVAMARGPEDLAAVEARGGWRPLEESEWRVWTDDYSAVIQAIIASRNLAARAAGD